MHGTARVPLTPPVKNERMAETLAEIEQLHEAYRDAVSLNEQQERVLVRQQDRIAMLEQDLANERDRARVCERKLIRLAANQRNISRIARDGDEIMHAVADWEPEPDDQPTTRDMAERLAPELEEAMKDPNSLPANRL